MPFSAGEGLGMRLKGKIEIQPFWVISSKLTTIVVYWLPYFRIVGGKTYYSMVKEVSKQLLLEIIGLLVSVVALYFIFKNRLNLDFWNDEIYTLKNFVFVPLSTTLLDYHVPNNHIFFNFLNNVYLKTIGIENLFDLMNNPAQLRILPFCYTVGTIIFTYLIGKKLGHYSIGIFRLWYSSAR